MPELRLPRAAGRPAGLFCSRRALAIDGVGDIVAAKLVELDLVRDPPDLYDVPLATLATLNLGSVEEPRVSAKRTPPSWSRRARPPGSSTGKWLDALSVPEVGESTARGARAPAPQFAELRRLRAAAPL
jgi:DNA ligase (NAD+)